MITLILIGIISILIGLLIFSSICINRLSNEIMQYRKTIFEKDKTILELQANELMEKTRTRAYNMKIQKLEKENRKLIKLNKKQNEYLNGTDK